MQYPCLTNSQIPFQRWWYLSTDAWPLNAQYINRLTQNYHPVSHTYIIYKIFDKYLKKAFLSFLSEARTISLHQHGFLPYRSCLYSLLVFEETVTRIMDEGHTAAVIYLDFVKTFDTIINRFFWCKWSPSVVVMSSCVGLKHAFVVGSREYT